MFCLQLNNTTKNPQQHINLNKQNSTFTTSAFIYNVNDNFIYILFSLFLYGLLL